MPKNRIKHLEPSISQGHTILTGAGGIPEYLQLTGNSKYLGTNNSGTAGVFDLPVGFDDTFLTLSSFSGTLNPSNPNFSSTTDFVVNASNNVAGNFTAHNDGITVLNDGIYAVLALNEVVFRSSGTISTQSRISTTPLLTNSILEAGEIHFIYSSQSVLTVALKYENLFSHTTFIPAGTRLTPQTSASAATGETAALQADHKTRHFSIVKLQ